VRLFETPTTLLKSDSTSLKTPPTLDEAVDVAAGAAAVVVAGWAAAVVGVVAAGVATATGVEVDVCPADQAEAQSIPIEFQSRAAQSTLLMLKQDVNDETRFSYWILLTPSSRERVGEGEHVLGQPRLRQCSWRPESFQMLSNAFSKWSRYKSQKFDG
jgi:S-formylglutathione hydrolase FrmB